MEDRAAWYTDADRDADGVDDDAANEEETSVTYTISSYGADYTVDSIVKRLQQGAFYVPPFQRSYVWSHPQASRFIESLLLGLPVPGVFLAKEEVTNKHLIIDGQQRLKTLQFFYEGTFKENQFRLKDVDMRWEGKTLDDLDSSDRLRLEDTIIHVTILKQDQPATDDTSIYLVFERLNTGASHLYPQEIRNCVDYGRLTTFLNKSNEDKSWRAVYGQPKPNPRLKDQELILRFLAFYYEHDLYERPMKGFLNRFSRRNRQLDESRAAEWHELFTSTIRTAHHFLGPKAFRPERNLNAAVFDAVMVATASRLKTSPITDGTKYVTAYEKLLEEREFRTASTSSTADEKHVARRLELATNALVDIP